MRKLPRRLGIAYDEWNVWYRTDDGTLEERYSFSDALAVGTYLNIFVRNCRWVRMANLAQMVNAIAPIVTTKDALALQPIWYPVLLHSQAALDVAADVHVAGPAISPLGTDHQSRWPHRVADLGPFTLVDAAATASADRSKLAVTVVNRSPDEPEVTEIAVRDLAFGDAARVRTLTADTSRSRRVLPDVEGACLEEGTEKARGQVLTLTLPPQSFTVIEADTTAT